jgi:hypothetical protein
MENVQVIEWLSQCDGQPSSLYRLDEAGAGERFFRDLLNNAETDGRESFRILEIPKEDWDAAEAEGAASA